MEPKQYLLLLSDPNEAIQGRGVAVLRLNDQTRGLFRLWKECFEVVANKTEDLSEIIMCDHTTTWYAPAELPDNVFSELVAEDILGITEADYSTILKNTKLMDIEECPFANLSDYGLFFTAYVGADLVETSAILTWDFLLEDDG